MFRNVRSSARDPLLPTSTNGRRGGGHSIYGGTRSSRPDISKSFIATVIWALVSVGLVAWGWLFCARRMEISTFSCNHFMCKFELTKGGAKELLEIPRSKLVAGEMVRVKKGEIAPDYGRLKRSEQRKLGYSYAIVYIEADSEDDDDESYDSYEDDDDSYDSYDDDQESSEDDDGGGERTIIPPRQKTPPQKMSPEAKEAIARRKEEREKYTRQRDEDRRKKGLPPIKEPDEPPRVYRDDDGDERFPGDAATMEKIKIEKPRFEEIQMNARAQAEARREKYNRELPSQEDMMQQANADMAARGWKNNYPERMAKSTSPDDPDNIKPPQKNVEGAAAAEVAKEDGSPDIARLEAEANEMEMRKGGGRDISSIGDHEELGELVQGDDTLAKPGPNGSRRKLLARRPPASRRSKQKLMEDASRDRDVHRKGHGHHQKSRPKAAHPRSVEEEEAEELGIAVPKTKTKHHHKAFHHKEAVPKEDRHHSHRGYHHRPGDVKVKGGWRHQNRQWHKHEKLKQLGTSYSLGRSKARKRKEAIDNYVTKKINKLEFTDSRRWRTGGVWTMLVGCMSAVFCLVIGNFQPRPKAKKSS